LGHGFGGMKMTNWNELYSFLVVWQGLWWRQHESWNSQSLDGRVWHSPRPCPLSWPRPYVILHLEALMHRLMHRDKDSIEKKIFGMKDILIVYGLKLHRKACLWAMLMVGKILEAQAYLPPSLKYNHVTVDFAPLITRIYLSWCN
jgi:hypothetical protein